MQIAIRPGLPSLPGPGLDDWIYRRSRLTRDLTAGLIATVMLIPQSLAYALLSVSKQGLSRVLLTMSAINRIATTALDALTNLDRVFKERDVCI